MFLSKRSRFKIFFKQFLKLRENVQNQKKLFKFQKKKWKGLIKHYKRKLRRYKKYAPIDQTKYLITRFPNRGTSYQKRYKHTLYSSKKFRLYYGGFLKKYFKMQIKKVNQNSQKQLYEIKKNSNMLFIKLFERRLDTLLYRAGFVFSIKTARQLIVHGKILVNNKRVKSKNYILKSGDLISVRNNCNDIITKSSRQMMKARPFWPLPQNHLFVNYKTMEIVFGDISYQNLSTSFTFYLQLEKVILNSKYQ